MSAEISVQSLENGYKSIFKESPAHFYFAPGRINLIGEHTDYNGAACFLVLLV